MSELNYLEELRSLVRGGWEIKKIDGSRVADEMHEREATATKCVESIVFTPEKIEKLGLEPDALPIGWWIGFHVGDDEVWAGVKSGRYKMFSIRGTGTREPLDA